jgi:hypothetical protein
MTILASGDVLNCWTLTSLWLKTRLVQKFKSGKIQKCVKVFHRPASDTISTIRDKPEPWLKTKTYQSCPQTANFQNGYKGHSISDNFNGITLLQGIHLHQEHPDKISLNIPSFLIKLNYLKLICAKKKLRFFVIY